MANILLHRVQKLLSNHGFCSRRKAEEIISQGRVAVNGKIISLGDKASEKDTISVDGKVVGKSRKVYLLFNKPLGCVTALRDARLKTVMDYIKIKERVFPIGRLDYNTSGLLLLTNDGDFANRIMHPRHEIKKTYLVEIGRPMTDSELRQIERGVHLDDGKTSPSKIRRQTDTLIEITIHEGKNRIIRRMLAVIGIPVSSLHRMKIETVHLGNLKPGTYRHLTDKERKSLSG